MLVLSTVLQYFAFQTVRFAYKQGITTAKGKQLAQQQSNYLHFFSLGIEDP